MLALFSSSERELLTQAPFFCGGGGGWVPPLRSAPAGGQDNGTARHAAWNTARPWVRTRVPPPPTAPGSVTRGVWLPGEPSLESRSGRQILRLGRPPASGAGVPTRLRQVRRPGPPHLTSPPRRVGAEPERFRPASRFPPTPANPDPPQTPPTQARFGPAPPPTARSPPDRAGRPSEGAWPQPSTRARALGLKATCRAT